MSPMQKFALPCKAVNCRKIELWDAVNESLIFALSADHGREFLCGCPIRWCGERACAETQISAVHQEADPRFLSSIERIGPCKISGPPITGEIAIPAHLYPKESVDKHEEGTVKIQLILDPDWCVRKATIVQTTKYWRLDNVSLGFVMTIKYMPKPTATLIIDGEPAVTIAMARGASQRKR